MLKGIFDWHCDTILNAVMEFGEPLKKNRGQIDLEKLRAGGALAQDFALFVFEHSQEANGETLSPYDSTLRQLEVFEREISANADTIALARCASDIEKNAVEGKISALLSLEGGIPAGSGFETVEFFYARGARLITLTWNNETPFGFPNSRDSTIMQKGLKPFGLEAVSRMCDMGMIPDVSHLSDGGFWDVARICQGKGKPFVASHSCCRALCPHPRCLTDEMLKALGDAGGVCGINFYSHFLTENSSYTSIDAVVRHMCRIRDKAGLDALAFGSDFDGIQDSTLEFGDYSGMGQILRALEPHFTLAEIDRISNGNSMRVIRDALG